MRPDLLVQATGGTLGPGVYSIEFERTAVAYPCVDTKLGPYLRMAGADLPPLMACESARGRRIFEASAGTLLMLAATLERALDGQVTGPVTVWGWNGMPTALHCW